MLHSEEDLEAARVPFESTKKPFDAVSRSVAQSECTQEALKVKRTGANVFINLLLR